MSYAQPSPPKIHFDFFERNSFFSKISPASWQSHSISAPINLSAAFWFSRPFAYVLSHSCAACFTDSTPVCSTSSCVLRFKLFLMDSSLSSIPNPNSAASSNKEFDHAGPLPFAFTVYGVDGEEFPQIEEQPVAFAIYILSPYNCVKSFAYAVSPHPAQAPWNSKSGCLNWLPFTLAGPNFSTNSSFSFTFLP